MWKCVLALMMAGSVCAQLETPVATFHGTLKSLSRKELVLEMPGDQTITFNISHKTKFLKAGKPVKPGQIPEGTPLSVDGKRDILGNTEAVAVRVEASAKP